MDKENASHGFIIADGNHFEPVRGGFVHVGLGRVSNRDREALESLFEACFASRADEQWYLWKYQSDARFDGIGLGMWEAGSLIAHYAGFPRLLVCGTSRLMALQIGDVMIHPKARHGLAKKNRFARLTQGYFLTYLKHRDTLDVETARFDIAYGFPNARHLQQGALQACYRAADAMFELFWRIDRSPNAHSLCAIEPAAFEHHPLMLQAFDDLSAAMLKALGPRGCWAVPRSLAYWQWRFPTQRGYQWLVIHKPESSDDLLAAAMVKPMAHNPKEYELVDWLCRPGFECEAFACLLAHLQKASCEYLRTWCSEAASRYFETMPADRIDRLDFQMALSIYPSQEVANQIQPRPANQGQEANTDLGQGGLWMLSGDTDFR